MINMKIDVNLQLSLIIFLITILNIKKQNLNAGRFSRDFPKFVKPLSVKFGLL